MWCTRQVDGMMRKTLDARFVRSSLLRDLVGIMERRWGSLWLNLDRVEMDQMIALH